MINDPAILTGVVLSGAHGIYEVHTPAGVIRCTLRGKLKKAYARANSSKPLNTSRQAQRSTKFLTSPQYSRSGRSEKIEQYTETSQPSRLSVGDYVKIKRLDDSTGDVGVIEEILPRQSELARKDAGSSARRVLPQTLLANLDQVVIVLAVAQPDPHFGFLDRYLAICESAELTPLICLNKLDLSHSARVEEEAALYSRLGYRVIGSSIHSGEGIEQLRQLLKGHTTLFTGPSGVGKSSLVNAIEPGMALRTGMVSNVTGKGRHTTTGSQLYPLSEGGWLADSAGIRALAAWDIAPEDLAWCFVEFRPYLPQYAENVQYSQDESKEEGFSASVPALSEYHPEAKSSPESTKATSTGCFYSDCRHIDEEGCAILQAVDDGLIDERRHRSYVRMYRGEER